MTLLEDIINLFKSVGRSCSYRGNSFDDKVRYTLSGTTVLSSTDSITFAQFVILLGYDVNATFIVWDMQTLLYLEVFTIFSAVNRVLKTDSGGC